jgi:hypothetical protein
MKVEFVKFHQPICLGTNYCSHVKSDDRTSLDWSQGVLTIDSVGQSDIYHVLSGNIEYYKTTREEYENKPKMGRPKMESK